jgi:hypothetical protein
MEEKDLEEPEPLRIGDNVHLLRANGKPGKKARVIFASPYCFIVLYRPIFFLPGLTWPAPMLFTSHEGKTWKRLP